MRKITLMFCMAFMAVLSAAAQAVTPPAGATVETWTVSYTYNDPTYGASSDTEEMQVVLSGSEVYFNFPNPITRNSWMKGTVSGTTATFASGQYVGSYQGEAAYYVGLDQQGLCDIVFTYDAAAGVFTLGDMWLLINGSTTKQDAWAYFSAVTVTREAPQVLTPVEAPAGLTTETYSIVASSLAYGHDGVAMSNVSWNVQLGFSGSDVYVQGLCRDLPEAWVKGTKDASDGSLTFASGQFLGRTYYNLFFAAAMPGAGYPTLADEVMFIEQNGSYVASGNYLAVNTSTTDMAPMELFAGVRLTKPAEGLLKPAAPGMTAFQPYDEEGGFGYIALDMQALSADGKPLLESGLSYRFLHETNGQQTVYTFKKSDYRGLSDDLTDIPYTFTDQRDIFRAGVRVYFYDDWAAVEKIGMQAVYTVGAEKMESDVTWFDAKAYQEALGISDVAARPVSVSYRDLQGRPLTEGAKGLVLKTTRMSNGTVQTVKMLRK